MKIWRNFSIAAVALLIFIHLQLINKYSTNIPFWDDYDAILKFLSGYQNYPFVEKIKFPVLNIISVFVWVVDLGDKDDFGKFSFYLRDCPVPEFNGYHLCHVAAETIDFLCCPIQ